VSKRKRAKPKPNQRAEERWPSPVDDTLLMTIEEGDEDDPFAVFTEWDSKADHQGYDEALKLRRLP
jgi:hypothetical protein